MPDESRAEKKKRDQNVASTLLLIGLACIGAAVYLGAGWVGTLIYVGIVLVLIAFLIALVD